MPEPEETKPPSKSTKRPAEDVAEDAIAQAADVVRKYQNHIVIATCLVILGVFGWKWWSGQKERKESWAWQGLQEGVTKAQLEKAVEEYADTAAAPFLRLRLGKQLHEEGKLAEAKKVFDELQALGSDHLAAQLARGRLSELRREEDFLKVLPGKLAELAKNVPPPLRVEEAEPEYGPYRREMGPTDAKPTPVPPGLEPRPEPPNPRKEPVGPPREMMAMQEPPK